MKIQISLSMSPDDYLADAKNAASTLNEHLAKTFNPSKFTTSAMVPTNAGILNGSLWITLVNVPKGSTDLQRLNAKMSMKFVMHLTNSSGKHVDTEQFSIEAMSLPRAIKYRKITGKSPSAAIEKFRLWLQKTEPEIHKLSGIDLV